MSVARSDRSTKSELHCHDPVNHEWLAISFNFNYHAFPFISLLVQAGSGDMPWMFCLSSLFPRFFSPLYNLDLCCGKAILRVGLPGLVKFSFRQISFWSSSMRGNNKKSPSQCNPANESRVIALEYHLCNSEGDVRDFGLRFVINVILRIHRYFFFNSFASMRSGII